MDGDIPPSQKGHALLGHDDLHHLLGLGAFEIVLGEKEHTYAVVPLISQVNAFGGGGLRHKCVGNLDHQAYAIAGLTRCVLACPVLQFFHDFQRIVHRLMGPPAPQIHYGADAAGVVLEPGIIQRGGGVSSLTGFLHGFRSNLL